MAATVATIDRVTVYIETAQGLVKLGLAAAAGIKSLFADENAEADTAGMAALDAEIHRRRQQVAEDLAAAGETSP